MRTLAVGSRGFTLLELLVVVAIMALATAGVGFALRDSADSQLEREAQRLIALLESARAQSRMTANPIRWRPTESGFVFDGAATAAPPTPWLGPDVLATVTSPVVLGPEPIIGPQRIVLSSRTQPGRSLTLATDGLRPFAVVTDGDPSAATP
jgi:general secretion pathway protein H